MSLRADQALARLDSGEPFFKYQYRGTGAYDVWVALRWGGEIYLGQIRTRKPLARAVDPGSWQLATNDLYDSMNSAAAALLERAAKEVERKMIA